MNRTLTIWPALAAIALMAGCSGCVSQKTVMVSEKTLATTRAAEAIACRAVIDEHAAGVLKGSKFNDFKRDCQSIDNLVTTADSLLKAGKTFEAQQQIESASKLIDQVKKGN